MARPIFLFIIGLGIYAAFAGSRLKIHSQDNHFVYLADAFLKGQVELARKPHHGNDWASYVELETKGETAKEHGQLLKGFFTRRTKKPNEFKTLDGRLINVPFRDRGLSKTRYFVSFPPMPAVLMMPFVAAVGYGANDVLFNIVFAALNGVLLYLVLALLRERGHSDRSDNEHLWLVVCFSLGSAHLWCGVLGQVWFTGLIVGVTFHLAYLYFAIDMRKPFLAGVCLAAAFATRAPLVFGAIFFYWQLFLGANRPRHLSRLWRPFLAFTLPCLIVGISLLIYNANRFENPLEFGHTYLAGGTIARIRDFGLFHVEFLTRNLEAAFTLLPRLSNTAPYLHLSKHGMSIFLSMPVLIWLFFNRNSSHLSRPIWSTVAAISALLLLYQNTGWEQFSYRFLLDLLPYFFVLLAMGNQSMGRWMKAAILWGVLVNIFGAATFQREGAKALYGYHSPYDGGAEYERGMVDS